MRSPCSLGRVPTSVTTSSASCARPPAIIEDLHTIADLRDPDQIRRDSDAGATRWPRGGAGVGRFHASRERRGPMRLALALTSAQADRLRKEADRLGIAPAVLARATLEDLCDLPDAGFRAAAERIVPKNHELSLASPDAVSDACRDPRAAPRDAGAVRWHAGHSRSGCPARCAGPAAPPWRPFSRCMVSASRRHAGISGLNATRLVWL